MSILSILGILFLLFLVEYLYFKVATHYNILDKPNHRSSHSDVTIRGGGVIFIVALLLYFIFFNFQYPYFILGLLISGGISFLDDLKPVSNKIRIICHLVSVALLFYQIGAFDQPIYLIIPAIVLAIGIINAINFMDGINGITGIYSLVTLGSLLYINEMSIIRFSSGEMIIFALLAVIVFVFFNFRRKAICFAGDVGSVGIAFIIIFLIAQLITTSGDITYLFLFLVYGLDTITTIIFRLFRGENIFEAHRSHFYQFLANEKKIPHQYVALMYGIIQLLINVYCISHNFYALPIKLLLLFVCVLIFVLLRFSLEGKSLLLVQKNRDNE